MAQDDYYYEIQLTNKQLVFYFMAGATGLILSFLAGVMVGRGVDATTGEVQAARTLREEKVVPEEPSPRPAPPAAEELTYAQRLESERGEEGLQKQPAARPPATPVRKQATPAPVQVLPPSRAVPATSSPVATPAPRPVETEPRPAAAGSFTIQVGAFKERTAAEATVARLKKKGFAAHVVNPDGDGLFNVRVGSYAARADAERIHARLRDEEKFKPFIVKN